MSLTRFTRLAAEASARIEEKHSPVLEQEIGVALRRVGRMAADRLLALRAAGDLPHPDEILQVEAVVGEVEDPLKQFTSIAYREMLDGTLGVMGVSFDVKNPLVEGVMEQLGQKITGIAESYRADLMAHLDTVWSEGLSVPDAAKAITSWSRDISVSRSTMIARTELAAGVNGGSLAAVRLGGVSRYKTWLATQDSSVREDHSEADGQAVPVDQPFQVGGGDLQFPGDPAGEPGEVINCRCTLLFGDDASGEATLASGYAPRHHFVRGVLVHD